MSEELLTTNQLAKYLQVSERTIASYRGEGKIPFFKINARNFRYKISDVEAALFTLVKKSENDPDNNEQPDPIRNSS